MKARDIAILEEIALTPSHGAAKGISKKLDEGRDAVQTSINNLRKAGYLETVTIPMKNGRVVKDIRITVAGNQFLETRTYTLLKKLNSNLLLNTNSYLYLPNSETSSRKGKKEMEYYDSPEEENLARQKHEARKAQEKVDAYNRRKEKRMERRDPRNSDKWTVTDSSFEFANRMHNIFHIAPFKLTESKLRFALAKKREAHGTNGTIEMKMMDIFFSKIAHDKTINDPNRVWAMFIFQYASLLEQAKQSIVTPEDLENERLESERSIAKFKEGLL